jgi:hypothetical protein
MKIYKYLGEKRFKAPSFSLDVSYDMRLAGERGREKPVLPLVGLKTPCPLDVLLAAPSIRARAQPLSRSAASNTTIK